MEGSPLTFAALLSAVPTASLDLHGLTAVEAERRVRDFVRTQATVSAGQVVEIITGKGTRSAGPAVLPRVVRELLDGELASSVREWAGAMGGGAVRVRLRGRARRPGRSD